MRSKNLLTRPSRRVLMIGAAAVLILVAVLITGCGGSSGGSSSSEQSSTANSGSGQEGGGKPGGFEISEEAQACLKEKGLELPEGGGPPEGFKGGEPPQGGEPPEGFEGGGPPEGFKGGEINSKAFEECGVELPQGKPGGPNLNSAAFKKQIKEYVSCVRENGYDLPEPNLSGEGPVFDESEVDQEDPKFKEASEACQSKLQGPSGGEAE